MCRRPGCPRLLALLLAALPLLATPVTVRGQDEKDAARLDELRALWVLGIRLPSYGG